MNIKTFCRCSLFPSLSGWRLISTPVTTSRQKDLPQSTSYADELGVEFQTAGGTDCLSEWGRRSSCSSRLRPAIMARPVDSNGTIASVGNWSWIKPLCSISHELKESAQGTFGNCRSPKPPNNFTSNSPSNRVYKLRLCDTPPFCSAYELLWQQLVFTKGTLCFIWNSDIKKRPIYLKLKQGP